MTGMGSDHETATKDRPDGVISPPGYFRDLTDPQIRGLFYSLLRADGISQIRASRIMRATKSQTDRDRQSVKGVELPWPEERQQVTRRRPRPGSRRSRPAASMAL